MTFGLALEAMNKGKKVALPHWSNDVFIKMNFPEKDNPYPSSSIKMTHKYMYVTSRYGTIPWIPTQIEILSEKWIIVE